MLASVERGRGAEKRKGWVVSNGCLWQETVKIGRIFGMQLELMADLVGVQECMCTQMDQQSRKEFGGISCK